ncbi:MAG: SDR family oxidoreductase [Thermoplasmata archaeon]|nr:SDR family oxidoreductase [Thermoplasmata archaeon]
MIADVNLDAARRVVAQIVATGGTADAVEADAGSPTDPDRAIAETVRRMGGVRILVNNAGVFPFSPADVTPVELWDRVLAINLRGAFLFARAAARSMRATGNGGAIVNIASIDSFHPSGNLAHYDASKGGLAMLTRSLAAEWGGLKIRVNAVAPGGINTPGAGAVSADVLRATGASVDAFTRGFLQHIPLGRMGEPDDIARATLFLASRASDYVTGAVLVVDGGYLVA